MELTLTDAQREALAAVAASAGNGRHAFRVKDAAVKSAAQDTVSRARALRKRANDKASRAERVAYSRMLARFNGYDAAVLCELAEHSDDCCQYGVLLSAWKTAPKRATIRRIARAVLAPASRVDACRNCAVDGKCEAHTIPADWRETVREYARVQRIAREAGSFAISRDDMRADQRSRFYRNVVKHWHDYAGGRHVAIHGVTPDDVTQDGFIHALESRDGLSFGTLYAHVRAVTETAIYSYRRYGNDHTSDNAPLWTDADWEKGGFTTLHEWEAYDAWKAAQDADKARSDALTARRESDAASLSTLRSSLYALVSTGMTVRQICNILGRTPEGLLSDLAADPTSLPVRFA